TAGSIPSPPQALADELRHQPELRKLDLSLDPPVQLGKARRDAISHENVDFHPGVVQQGSEFGVRELLEAGPVVVPANAVVQEAVVGEGRLPGLAFLLHPSLTR